MILRGMLVVMRTMVTIPITKAKTPPNIWLLIPSGLLHGCCAVKQSVAKPIMLQLLDLVKEQTRFKHQVNISHTFGIGKFFIWHRFEPRFINSLVNNWNGLSKLVSIVELFTSKRLQFEDNRNHTLKLIKCEKKAKAEL